MRVVRLELTTSGLWDPRSSNWAKPACLLSSHNSIWLLDTQSFSLFSWNPPTRNLRSWSSQGNSLTSIFKWVLYEWWSLLVVCKIYKVCDSVYICYLYFVMRFVDFCYHFNHCVWVYISKADPIGFQPISHCIWLLVFFLFEQSVVSTTNHTRSEWGTISFRRLTWNMQH